MPATTLTNSLFEGIVQLITLPYHRFFLNNTLRPTKEILNFADGGVARHGPDRKKLHALLFGWRNRKVNELTFVSVAGVSITAIVSASLAWPTIEASHWVGSAFWYASLMTSVCGILIAAQQISLLTLLGDLPPDQHAASATKVRRHLGQLFCEVDGQWRLSWRMIFTWQVPMMFIGYSFLFYFIGLTVVVCTPLIRREEWGPNIYIAITYLVASAISWGLFAFCSLGGYNAVTLDHEDDEEDECHVGPGGTDAVVGSSSVVAGKGEA